MLQKLWEYGFSGSVLLWFKNYLCGHLQHVTVHGATSQAVATFMLSLLSVMFLHLSCQFLLDNLMLILT